MKTRTIILASILLLASSASFGGGFGDILSGAVNDMARQVAQQAGAAAQRAMPPADDDEFADEDIYYEYQPYWVSFNRINAESKQSVRWFAKEYKDLLDGDMRKIKFATVYRDPVNKIAPIVLIFNTNSGWCGSGGCSLTVLTDWGGNGYYQHMGVFGNPDNPGVSFSEGADEMYLDSKGKIMTARWNPRLSEWVRIR